MTSRINQAAERWRPRIVGVDCQMLRLDGRPAPYVNFDNAASTPPLAEVVETVERFLPYYSNVHRGTGFKSRVSTALYDEARKTIAGFVGADERTHTVVFGKNTTEAINKLAHRYPFERDSVVITTALEHHSNDLPWRRRAHVVRVRADDEGRLDEEHFDHLLECHRERVALVAVSGASNVTGLVPPIHRLASKAHAAGARILVDAAQLAAHRRIDIRRAGDPEHLDFVAFSAHKMYAPFGVGALVGPRDVFLQGEPEYSGGGTVDVVTADDVYWADPPDREEAGTPNVVGAIAMAAAARELSAAGLDRIEHDEALLTSYALERLRQVPETTIYGSSDPSRVDDRLGVISFNLHSSHHALVAAILGWEAGIGVRSGCFCAQPYVAHLLHLTGADGLAWRRDAGADRSRRPGMVRVSLGLYNTPAEIDLLVEMLCRIVRGACEGVYRPDPESGQYWPIESRAAAGGEHNATRPHALM